MFGGLRGTCPQRRRTQREYELLELRPLARCEFKVAALILDLPPQVVAVLSELDKQIC